jgi:hypothetical protein
MHRRARLFAVCVALSPVCACFLANGSDGKKIGDAVQNLNDQARWGLIQDATLLVQPDYRERFLTQHRRWGSEIQLADSEVVNVSLASDSKLASALVTYSWYARNDMTLHETTLRQLWKARSSNFALASEAVVRGDPGLLQEASQSDSHEP